MRAILETGTSETAFPLDWCGAAMRHVLDSRARPSREITGVSSADRAGRANLTIWREQMDNPRIFLGSSGKQQKLLQALTRGLADVAYVEPWTTSFNPGTTTLERLLELTHEVDFAAFVFARDDWTSTSPSASPPPES